jgi:phosphoribosylamine--glycine ligase
MVHNFTAVCCLFRIRERIFAPTNMLIMRILVVGSGGREHALAWKLSKSPLCTSLFIAPGNAGTAQCGQNISIQATEKEAIVDFCVTQGIDLVVVGPEAPLVDGLVDVFRADELRHIRCIGPTAAGAMLEGSKAFAKKFMQKYGVPTAAYIEVTKEHLDEGVRFLHELSSGPYVLKADGLAAGKGVLIIQELDEAILQLREMLEGKFGQASETVVIEQFLDGIEFSVFALTDGKDYILLPEAKDYKRVGEGDTGLNTGGMGAVSPVPFVTSDVWQKVEERIICPTIEGIDREGMDYIGFVFFGLILCNGEPFVIEYNCRLGDPETEVVIPRIESDLADVLLAVAEGRMKEIGLQVSPQSAAAVMLVSGGYPGDFRKGLTISGLEDVTSSMVFHAGTSRKENDVVTQGGRVLAVTSFGETFQDAVRLSVENAGRIHYEACYFRRDIGFDLG